MKKLNKKGFTLIEMLVVIAIIAVLVAIIIPTVMRSTDKAAAATNAANLRSYKAELTTALLAGDNLNSVTAPKAKAYGTVAEGDVATFTQDPTTGSITVKFGSMTIDDFATAAGTSSTSVSPSAKT